MFYKQESRFINEAALSTLKKQVYMKKLQWFSVNKLPMLRSHSVASSGF